MFTFSKFLSEKRNPFQALLVAIIFMSVTNESVSQVVVPFEQRTSIYSPDKKIYNIRGDFQMIGNTNMTLLNYSNIAPNSNNQMIYVDIDGNPTTVNSSSAVLELSTENGADPDCSNIIYAGLYWTGRAHDGESPTIFTIPGQDIASEGTYKGYVLTIEQTQSGYAGPRHATYTFTPSEVGDVVIFRYNTWFQVFVGWQSTLTVQVGNGQEVPIGYTESQNSISVATLRTPFLFDTGSGTPFYINSFRKHRDNNSINSSNFFATTAKLLDKRHVRLKHASASGYKTVLANVDDIYYPTVEHGYMYAGYAEVTDYVKKHGTGEYTVADIALLEGNGGSAGFYGGWGMVVIYENSKMTWRDITVYDGYAYVEGGAASHELPVSGFHTARSGPIEMKLGIIAGEGDRDIAGDYLEIRPHSAPNTWRRLGHPGASANAYPPNFFNSSVQTGGNARNPNLLNNTGLDIVMFNIDNANNSIITNNQTSTTFRYGSTQDTYIISCIAMAVDAYVPAIETTNFVAEVVDSEYDGGAVFPGDEIVFEMEVRNKGSEDVKDLLYVLPIPYTATFIGASAAYVSGSSGTITYDPTRGATGAILWNIDSAPLLSDNDRIVAKLTYKLKVTTDCFILSKPHCPPSVTNEGVYTGIGVTSGISFTNDRFVLGNKPYPCDAEPIYGTLSTLIDRDAFIMDNCDGGVGYDNRIFYYCDEIDSIVPFAVIANSFPAGTKFYDDIEFLEDQETGLASNIVTPTDTAKKFKAATGFPKAYSGPYYAIPPGQANTCYWEFDILLSDNCVEAFDDYVTIFRSVQINFGSAIIDVLANDYLGLCERSEAICCPSFPVEFANKRGGSSSLEIGIVSGKGPAHGTVELNADSTIKYTSEVGYLGLDSFLYYIKCEMSTDTAIVYINVVESADNISDEDCFITTSATIWDIEMKKMSSVPVHYLATPFAGDLDNDGRIEVVAPGVNSMGSMSDKILIFDDSLKLISTIELESNAPQSGTTNLLIADVDNDNFGELVVCTENRTLLCYSHLGVKKWGPTEAYNADDGSHTPSLIIADINGDGFAEILAVDKIYDAATGSLLVSLPTGGRGFSIGGLSSYMPVFADIDNDGILEVLAGNTVYKITINSRIDASQNNAEILSQMPDGFFDGFTSVADIDGDGDLDVIVTGGMGNSQAMMYVWDGATPELIGEVITMASPNSRISRSLVGDITGTGMPDIAFTYTHNIVAYSYDSATDKFAVIFSKPTTDDSGATTMSMFDFNHDGEVELVYRDRDSLRIIDKSGGNVASFPCYSSTHTEYPIIVDLDRDGHADILVSGATSSTMGESSSTTGTYIMHFGSKTPNQWASARGVWNQHAYNAVNINEDLTVPRRQLNPTMVFAGADGIFGNDDDVTPLNNFLQQQTNLNMYGLPLWLTPDAMIDEQASAATASGNAITVHACFRNMGDAPIGSPVFATLYNNTISTGSIIAVDSAHIKVGVGESGCVTIVIPDGSAIADLYNIIVRINDRDGNFAYQAECDSSNNVMSFVNPLLMRKNATLQTSPPFAHNGTYPNPVSILGNEVVTYTITAVNALSDAADITIIDTLPAYFEFVDDGTVFPVATPYLTATNPARHALRWDFVAVPARGSVAASFNATPHAGAVASQPLFTNKAWVAINNLRPILTNSTYHQGAGISIATFSAGLGGNIYNAAEQALDYMSTPLSGIIIAPEEGYRFAGWSHDDYYSLRGAMIRKQENIMHYDTLTIYGDVDLRANFRPEEYPVNYYLNGSENADINPATYTILSEMITLATPHKAGDTFIGWTGSNGESPQLTVSIPKGSTGERTFYANFLLSGREVAVPTDSDNKVWATADELHIRTSKPGSVVKVYSIDGALHTLHTIVSAGEATIKLPRGIYVVTLNGGVGQLVRIEQ